MAPLGAAFAFILSSNRARCSGVNLSSIPWGIGIWPTVVKLVVVSHKPGFTFKGCNLAALGADRGVFSSLFCAFVTVLITTKRTKTVTNGFIGALLT
jgi:hypothetical protein